MKIFRFSIYCLLFISLITCAKKPSLQIITSPEQEFNRALDLLEIKKYNQAIEILQNIVFNYPGTTIGADAQFYLAEAYFRKKDYSSAIPEFVFFINSFSGSQHLEEAYYKLALCYFNMAQPVSKNQLNLEKTLEMLDELQERFPNTQYHDEITQMKQKIAERYAEKNYLTGELYFKGGEFSSARVYFDYVLDQYPETKWAKWSKYILGQIYEKTDSLSQAIEVYQSLLSDSTDTRLKNLVQNRLATLRAKQ